VVHVTADGSATSELLDQNLARFERAVEHDHLQAERVETSHGRGAEASGATGDDRRSPAEVHAFPRLRPRQR